MQIITKGLLSARLLIKGFFGRAETGEPLEVIHLSGGARSTIAMSGGVTSTIHLSGGAI